MEPNKFRESREAIKQLCQIISHSIEKKDLEASKEIYEKAFARLEDLKPQAEGEIQERSVKNLGVKMHILQIYMNKLKPAKKKSRKAVKKGAIPAIVWDEKKLEQLSVDFLKKVLSNMANDADSTVCFGTTGKGIRPSYRIEFSNQKSVSFSGAGHGPLSKQLPKNTKKTSDPFPFNLIESLVKEDDPRNHA